MEPVIAFERGCLFIILLAGSLGGDTLDNRGIGDLLLNKGQHMLCILIITSAVIYKADGPRDGEDLC